MNVNFHPVHFDIVILKFICGFCRNYQFIGPDLYRCIPREKV